MVWHILRKDVRLLWVLAVGVGSIHLIMVLLRSWLGLFEEPRQLILIADLLSLLSLFGIIALTIAVMHQDAVPGVRQDWLIRPIKRGDLILAKLLFVILVVQGPLLIADVLGSLLQGFGLLESLGAAASRNIAVLSYCSLPAMMIGAVTRSLLESFVVFIVGILAYAVVFIFGVVMLLGFKTSIGGTGLSWMLGATLQTLALAGTLIVLCMQFLRRRTAVARSLIAAGGAIVILSSFLPWQTAFALEQSLAKEPGAADRITLAFDPAASRFKLPLGAAEATNSAIYLPLRVTGVPLASLMLMDRANIRIADGAGKTLYEGRTNLSVDGVGSIQDARLEFRQTQNGDAPADVYQRIFIPTAVLTRLGDQPVSVDIDYYFTLFRSSGSASIAASGGHQVTKELGRCATRIDGEGDDVDLRCVDTALAPTCFTAFLVHVPSGLRNPDFEYCEPNYSPKLLAGSLWPDALSRFGGDIRFFDRKGLAHYPVDGTKLANARVTVETFSPRSHFSRHLSIPTIELPSYSGPAARPSAGS